MQLRRALSEARMMLGAPAAGGRAGRSAACGAAATIVAGALALALGGVAQAATRPSVLTGGATSVSYGSAVLTGTVNPGGGDTSYYFQYGPTRAYGGQSAIADAGAGIRTVHVRLGIAGLQPLTVYHYRLVGVNGAGARAGGDRTFMTTKVPLSLQIVSSPNPVLFGGDIVVQGTLSGTENANRAVVLQGNTFPFTAGFQDIGNPELTSATGGFSFPVLGLSLVTQFRVATLTRSPVLSPVVVEGVAVRVASRVARTRRRHFVRFFGTVTPAEDGMQVGILRIVRGRSILAGGTVLRHRNATSSRFSRVVRVKAGVYRVLVRVTSGAQISNYGQTLAIR